MIVPEISAMAKEVELIKLIEIPGRLVQAIVKCTSDEREITETIVLWDGQDYINIGQYTDTDVKNRLNELLNG